MKESDNILPDGYGTPYLAIFNKAGKPIMDPLNNLPLGVFMTNFFYEYKTNEEDESEITIETDNPDILDLKELQHKRSLKLQWGWILPDGKIEAGPLRTVVIMDTEATFAEDGCTFTLKCKDGFALLRNEPSSFNNSSEKYYNGSLLSWLKYQFSGNAITELIDYNAGTTTNITKVSGMGTSYRETIK